MTVSILLKQVWAFLFTSLCFLVLSGVSGQPVIGLDDLLPTPGETISIGSSIEVLPLGGPGEDMIWDYADLTTFSASDFSFEPVNSQVGADQFPSSTHVFSDDSQFLFQYFSFGQDSATIDGSAIELFGDVIVSQFADPVKLYEFPIEFENVFTDTYASIDEMTGNILSRTELTSTVDGYGTLIMPSGSVEDVLRILRTGESENFAYDMEGNATDSVTSTLTQVEFVAAGNPRPLISYSIIGQDTSITFVSNLLTSTKEMKIPSYLSIFPNPVSDGSITVSSNEKVNSVALYDLNGRLLDSINKENIAGSRELRMDCSNLANGTYLMRVGDKNGYHSKKIVVNN